MTADTRLDRIDCLYKSVANSIFKGNSPDLASSPISLTDNKKKLFCFLLLPTKLLHPEDAHLFLLEIDMESRAGHDEGRGPGLVLHPRPPHTKVTADEYRRGVLAVINQGFTQKADLINSFKTVGLIGLNSITHMPTGSCSPLFCKQKSKQPIMKKRTTPPTPQQKNL